MNAGFGVCAAITEERLKIARSVWAHTLPLRARTPVEATAMWVPQLEAGRGGLARKEGKREMGREWKGVGPWSEEIGPTLLILFLSFIPIRISVFP
jgi:hypothetical protein